MARRALEVAAAGGHHLLMVGPPGAGKTLLARCLPGILPRLTASESKDSGEGGGMRGHSAGCCGRIHGLGTSQRLSLAKIGADRPLRSLFAFSDSVHVAEPNRHNM